MKTIISLAFLLMGVYVYAQIVNVNPDPNGDPWIAGDALPMPPVIEAELHIMQLTPQSAATPLPAVVKNNELMYMPPVFNQGNTGSCVQAAEVWYCFAYEINRLRELCGGEEIGDSCKANQYHPFFAYNFINGGDSLCGTASGSGSHNLNAKGTTAISIFTNKHTVNILRMTQIAIFKILMC